MKFKVLIHKEENGGYWAECPALLGCFSQGETIEEVTANIKEAIECHMESIEKEKPLVGDKPLKVISVEV